MQFLRIPYSFIQKHLKLSWNDALWGYEHQIIGWSDIVDIAIDRLVIGSNEELEIDLASMTKSEVSQIGELLRKLAFESAKNEDYSKKKWLYLILAWLYENKENNIDPLGDVENIYADFDYPSEIEDFIRYMPPSNGYDPSIHTENENENRLFNNWKSYLDMMESELVTCKPCSP